MAFLPDITHFWSVFSTEHFWSLVPSFILSCSAAYTAIKGIPILSTFLQDRLKLTRQLEQTRLREAEAKSAADAFELSSKGWQTVVASLGDEVKEATRKMAKMTEEIHALRTQLGSAVLYITDLHKYLRTGGIPPKIPDDLTGPIEEALAARLENNESAS